MMPLQSTQRTPSTALARSARGSVRPDDVAAIVRAGLRAPSGDNTQPWRIRVDGTDIHVGLDEERARCAGFGGVAGFMSIGALIEGMRLEALRRGFGALIVNENDHHWRVEVGVGTTATAGSELAEAIEARRTNRAPYATTAVADADLQRIEDERGRGASLVLRSRRDDVHAAAKAAALAERVRFDTVDPRALNKWLRYSPRAAAKTSDGLDVRLLELRPQERLGLRLSVWRGLIHVMRAFGAGRLASERARGEVLASGAVGVVTQQGLSPTSFVESGRTMMRAWLRATLLGHAFAPVTMAALLPLTRHLGESFSGRHNARLDEAEALVRRTFGVAEPSFPVFMFRIGTPTRLPVVRSRRRCIASFAEANA